MFHILRRKLRFQIPLCLGSTVNFVVLFQDVDQACRFIWGGEESFHRFDAENVLFRKFGGSDIGAYTIEDPYAPPKASDKAIKCILYSLIESVFSKICQRIYILKICAWQYVWTQTLFWVPCSFFAFSRQGLVDERCAGWSTERRYPFRLRRVPWFRSGLVLVGSIRHDPYLNE